MEISCKNTLGVTPVSSPDFQNLKFHTKHSILILYELRKIPDGGVSKNLSAIFRAAMIEIASDRLYLLYFLKFCHKNQPHCYVSPWK